jgi:rSAM/selenodomain-associated transferase 2
MKYSVVIPTLNAEEFLDRCLSSVKRARKEVEIIVVDGSSTDRTYERACKEGVLFEHSLPRRGYQLNQGAKRASGEIILFLHADTFLPSDAFSVIDASFDDHAVNLATFQLKFDHDHWLLRLYGKMSKIDSLWTTFGDQCIVVRKDFFEYLGGFPDWPLFEDVEFLRNARQEVKVNILDSEVVTSSRKFVRNGMLKQQIKNGWLICQYLKGVPPEKLFYEYSH